MDKNISEADLNDSELIVEHPKVPVKESLEENMDTEIDANCSVDEVLLQLDDKPESLDVSNEIENEDIDDDDNDDENEPDQEPENDNDIENEGSSDESGDEDYSESDEDDNIMMARANLYASSPRIKQEQPPKPAAIMNDEPIPLSSDDEDDNENTNESEKHWKKTGNTDNVDSENDSSDFSVDNNPIISEDEQSIEREANLNEYHDKNARRLNNMNLRIRKKCIKKSLKLYVANNAF